MPAITDYLTNNEVLQLLGCRLRERRLNRDMSVEQLSERAGVNRKTILGLETGVDARVSSLIKIMRGLDILADLDAAVPDALPSGEGISTRGQPRKKASSSRL